MYRSLETRVPALDFRRVTKSDIKKRANAREVLSREEKVQLSRLRRAWQEINQEHIFDELQQENSDLKLLIGDGDLDIDNNTSSYTADNNIGVDVGPGTKPRIVKLGSNIDEYMKNMEKLATKLETDPNLSATKRTVYARVIQRGLLDPIKSAATTYGDAVKFPNDKERFVADEFAGNDDLVAFLDGDAFSDPYQYKRIVDEVRITMNKSFEKAANKTDGYTFNKSTAQKAMLNILQSQGQKIMMQRRVYKGAPKKK